MSKDLGQGKADGEQRGHTEVLGCCSKPPGGEVALSLGRRSLLGLKNPQIEFVSLGSWAIPSLEFRPHVSYSSCLIVIRYGHLNILYFLTMLLLKEKWLN